MIKIKIHRKKQFASLLVPFYIVLNENIDKVKNAIKDNCLADLLSDKNSDINIYPIKSNQTIIFNISAENARILAINNNFVNSKIYPLALTEEILIKENINLQLSQSKSFSTVKIELKEADKIDINNNSEIIEYNL